MKLKYPLIAAFVAILSLTACGGGGGDSGSGNTSIPVASPAQLVKTDTAVGTGNAATSGSTVTLNYTAYLYSTTATGNMGAKVDSGTAYSFVLSAGKVIDGLDQGVEGMKVGGKRMLQIPAGMAFGAVGNSNGSIPANSGVVFEVELTNVVYPTTAPAQFTKTDTVVGTGAEAVAGKTATVTYTGWLYSETAADHKGTQFDTGTFPLVLGSGSVIPGFNLGVTGMKVGGKRTVFIPSTLGYGAAGNGTLIPANAGLVFDIQLTNVQ
jgi:peptidylprolyl isomerase